MPTSYLVSNESEMFLNVAISTTQTSGIIIAAPQRNGSNKTFGTTAGGVLRITSGSQIEDIFYQTATVNADYTVTLSATGLIRNLDPNNQTAYVSLGAGYSFGKGSVVELTQDCRLFNLKASVDTANTFTGTQTVTTLDFGGTSAYIKTTDSGTNLKFKDGSTAEQTLSALAAAAGTDHKVLATSADTTANYLNSKITVTSPITKTTNNPAGNEDIGLSLATVTVPTGGTGLTSATAYAVVCGGTTSTGAFQSIASVGSSTNVLTSNGASNLPTFQAPKYYDQVVYMGYTTSSSTPISDTNTNIIDTHNYTIPANDLIAAVGYEVTAIGVLGWGAGTYHMIAKLGSTNILDLQVVPTQNQNALLFRFTVMGTAAAGASVTVRCMGNATTGQTNTAFTTTNYVATGSIATNGTLLLQLAAKFDSSNSNNTMNITMMTIKKISSTVF